MTKPTLSVALATFNEAENISRCLTSIKDIADEIIIVDGGSSDETVEIAQKFKARIIETTNKPIFHINKQMAIEAATGEWVLALDADEEVSPKLAKEILAVIKMNSSEVKSRKIDPHKRQLFDRHMDLLEVRDGVSYRDGQAVVAFFVPRLNMFLGHPMRYTGVYPDGAIRLFKKGSAYYPAKSVHEQIVVTGRVDWLEHDLLHYDSPTFHKYLMRANRYTTLTATELKKQHKPISLLQTLNYLLIKPVTTFLQLFIRHKGYKDGMSGFIFSLFSGLHFAIAYLKYWELLVTESRDESSD